MSFDLLSDWFREVSKKYGVYHERDGVARRFSFLIDKSGVVRFVHSSELIEPRDHEEMMEQVKKLWSEK